ncbi:MAG: YjgN family protein [Gemmatimonadales bacterium]
MPGIVRPSYHGSGGALFGRYLKTALLSIITLGIYAFWGKSNIRAYLYGNTDLGGDRFAYHGLGGELFRGWIKAFGLILGVGIVAAMIGYALSVMLAVLLFYGAIAFWFFPLALIGSRGYRLSRTSWRGIRLSFRGELDDCIGVFVPGVLLTVVTLGLYFPYFHANMRRFLVDHSSLGDRDFSFSGQGGELFGPFVLAVILTPLTLGIYWFWWMAFRDRYYWSHTRLGDVRFSSSVTGGSLFGLTLVNGLLLVLTLGIGFAWVKTRVLRYYCDHLAVDGLALLDTIRQDAQPADVMGEGMGDMLDVDLVGADFFGL